MTEGMPSHTIEMLKFKIIAKYILFAVLFIGAGTKVMAQPEGQIAMGVAIPLWGSDNAPAARTSIGTALGLWYRLPSAPHWRLGFVLGNISAFNGANPSATAVPLDTAMYVKRYMFNSLTLGVSYMLPIAARWRVDFNATIGAYFRYINVLQNAAVLVWNDMDELGFGPAARIGAEAVYRGRWSIGAYVNLYGNPFTETGSSLPAPTKKDETVTRHFSRHHLEGFGRLFAGVSIGYHIP